MKTITFTAIFASSILMTLLKLLYFTTHIQHEIEFFMILTYEYHFPPLL